MLAMIWRLTGLLLVQHLNSEALVPKNGQDPKIAHGQEVENIEDYGYSAYFLLLGSRSIACGASILNQKILLTAAHCIVNYSRNTTDVVTIKVGSIHSEAGGYLYPVKALIAHEDYDMDTVQNDIGLVAVARNIAIGSKAHRVILSLTTPEPGLVGTVAGWGLVNEETEDETEVLLYAKQKIMTKEKCQTLIDELPDKVFCAGEKNDTSYPLAGDSGSALVLEGGIQVGVVSFRSLEAAAITVYTDVSQYFDWIRENTKRAFCSDTKHLKILSNKKIK